MGTVLEKVTRRVNVFFDAVRLDEIRYRGKFLGFAKFRHDGTFWQSYSEPSFTQEVGCRDRSRGVTARD